MKSGINLAGALMLLIGAVWTLQGMNILLGSFMSGQTQWLLIGLVVAAAAAALLAWNNFVRR